MSLQENIFRFSPPWIKNILVSLYGTKEHIKTHGKYFNQHYKEFTELITADESNIKHFQAKKLKELFLESMKYSPYYRNIFSRLGVSEEKIRKENTLYLLQSLPFLEKETLRNQTAQIVSTNPVRKTCGVINTSGTTGTPMSIEFDAESKQCTYAEWRRYYDWLGLPEKFRSVRFSGRIIVDPGANQAPFWVYNAIYSQLFMSTYHLSDKNMKAYIRKLNYFKPEFLDGFPSAFYILALYILGNDMELQFKPIAISTTAETLFDHQREMIEKAFGCKVYNQYASSEGSPWIVECKEGHYHLWTDTGVFEFIDQKDNGDGTVIAEMVVTSFRNFKTPLIRYRIGDYVSRYKEEQTCSCGSHYPMIHSVIGRQDDILYTLEKGRVGRLDPAFKGLSDIKKSKIIQKAIDHIEVLLVPDKNYRPIIGDKLLDNLHDRLGKDINIKLIETDEIPFGKNGKFKSVERQFSIEEYEKRI